MSFSIDKQWMNESNRRNTEYVEGVRNFVKFVAANGGNKEKYSCPCTRCKNEDTFKLNDIHFHLLRYGIVQSYTVWCFHGERISEKPKQQPVGNDVKGRSRTIGTNIAPTQVKGAAIPCKRLKEAQGQYEQRLQNVEQKLTKLDTMDDKLERLLSIAQDNRQVGSEIGTSQFATPTNQLIDQRCEILNFEDEIIATGTICRDSTSFLIHGKQVPPTYEKVVLDKILLPDELTAKICRQFTETFGDVGVGGYVSHQKGLIRYL